MFRKTSKDGEVEVDRDIPSLGHIKARLYDFDFDDFDSTIKLKGGHTGFLTQRVLPLLKDDSGHIWLEGAASRIGNAGYNKQLSNVRAGRVAGFLYEHGVTMNQVQQDAIGEEGTERHALDDKRDRAVTLWVYPKLKFDPPPPRRVPPKPSKPKVSQKFKIAMLTGLSVSQSVRFAKYLKLKVGAGFAMDVNFFVVWDTTNNLSCLYVYIGLGLGLGLELPINGNTKGPWNSFTTDKPMAVWQFGRWSRFTTVGAATLDLSWLTIETPKGVSNMYEQIDTGVTIGAGMSTTVGDFIRIEGPSRFSGP